jgi:hypothetical protein
VAGAQPARGAVGLAYVRGLPVVAPEEAAVKIARAYLRRPEFLPELPPANRSEREDQS